MSLVKDPVCHAQVDARTSGDRGLTSVHGGQRYHFCSTTCKHSFDLNPSGYVAAHGGPSLVEAEAELRASLAALRARFDRLEERMNQLDERIFELEESHAGSV